MPEQVLTILKLCLLALVYLFFLRVLRAVWSEVQEPSALPGAGKRTRRRAPASGTPPRPPSTAKGAAVGAGAVAGVAGAAAGAPRRPGRNARGDRAPKEIVVVGPEHMAGASARLDAEVTIGRGGPATIVVDDSYVSQAHTRLTPRDGRCFVEDMGSTNGTYLNGRRVTAPAIVHRGDRLQLGNVLLEVR